MSTDSVTTTPTAAPSSPEATPVSAPAPQVGEGTRAHAADMLAHLAPRLPAVWQQDLVQPRFHDLSLKKILVGKLFFSHIHLLCSLSHGVPKQRRI